MRKLPKHLIGRYQAPEISSNPGRDVMVVQSQNLPTYSQNINIFTHKIASSPYKLALVERGGKYNLLSTFDSPVVNAES